MSNRVSRVVSDETLNRIIQIESAGKPRAKAPTSSATGLFQFLDKTWLGTVRKHRPDWLKGRSQKQVLAMRVAAESSIEMGARFTEDNAKMLGQGWRDGDLYLAHFLGIGDARRVFRAPQSDSVETHVSAGAVRANRSILQGRTCAQVRAWAERSMVSRWAQAGKTDWIGKYWKKAAAGGTAPEPEELGGAPTVDDDIPEDATPVKVEEPERENASPPRSGVEIEVVQRRLAAMGYSPGMIDGKWGGGTAAAIAAFKNDMNVIGEPVIDDALLAALDEAESQGFRRPIAAARANATAADIAPRVETVRETWRSRLAAKIGAIGLAISSFFGWIVDKFQDLQENAVIQKIVGMVGSVPWYVWTTGLIAVLGFIWQSQRKAEKSVTTAYNEGRLLAGEDEENGKINGEIKP